MVCRSHEPRPRPTLPARRRPRLPDRPRRPAGGPDGAEDTVEGELVEVGFAPGDVLLLSTDGLHGVLDDSRIADILASSPSLPDVGKALVDSVLESGAPDNVTAVLISADAE